MQWTKEHVEAFFGKAFTKVDSTNEIHEIRFEVRNFHYLLWIDEQKESLFLWGDTRYPPECSHPAIEIGGQCRRIEETEAIGIGPVLLFYESSEKCREHIRLCITRAPANVFSVASSWPIHEPPTKTVAIVN
jgi:hypothetical protein